jgi:hypothetical protein
MLTDGRTGISSLQSTIGHKADTPNKAAELGVVRLYDGEETSISAVS